MSVWQPCFNTISDSCSGENGNIGASGAHPPATSTASLAPNSSKKVERRRSAKKARREDSGMVSQLNGNIGTTGSTTTTMGGGIGDTNAKASSSGSRSNGIQLHDKKERLIKAQQAMQLAAGIAGWVVRIVRLTEAEIAGNHPPQKKQRHPRDRHQGPSSRQRISGEVKKEKNIVPWAKPKLKATQKNEPEFKSGVNFRPKLAKKKREVRYRDIESPRVTATSRTNSSSSFAASLRSVPPQHAMELVFGAEQASIIRRLPKIPKMNNKVQPKTVAETIRSPLVIMTSTGPVRQSADSTDGQGQTLKATPTKRPSKFDRMDVDEEDSSSSSDESSLFEPMEPISKRRLREGSSCGSDIISVKPEPDFAESSRSAGFKIPKSVPTLSVVSHESDAETLSCSTPSSTLSTAGSEDSNGEWINEQLDGFITLHYDNIQDDTLDTIICTPDGDLPHLHLSDTDLEPVPAECTVAENSSNQSFNEPSNVDKENALPPLAQLGEYEEEDYKNDILLIHAEDEELRLPPETGTSLLRRVTSKRKGPQ